VTQRRRLEAPHRRLEATPPRIVEQAAVIGYRSMSAVLAFVPPALSRAVIGGANQLAYVLWPAKRRSSNLNYGHVLGLPPDDPRVARLALRAYRGYARYMVELMRLPSRPHAELAAAIEGDGADRIGELWRSGGRPVIVAVGHLGNNEAVGAALAQHGYPINVVADDSTFPELFEYLRRQREGWGVRIIPWRNLRELFGALRRREILALLVDWGYRSDGIPVRLFGAWTALPAGPAVLAAKTGAWIAPLAVRRTPRGRFRLEAGEPFEVPSGDPASLQRATQRIADFLEAAVRAAPDQWYSFKPIWPADAGEREELATRAAGMLDGRADPGPSTRPPHAAPAPPVAAGS
jgi:KDO2-lipid IV(A) lauroyltransferase